MEYPIRYVDIRDRDVPDAQSGEVTRFKEYRFFLGKFGPFTERIPVDGADQTAEIQRRVDALRMHLGLIHT